MAPPYSTPLVITTPMINAMPVSRPLNPSHTTIANPLRARIPASMPISKIRRDPHRNETRPHLVEVRENIMAANEMVAPMCHSFSPISRDSGARIGLRIICPIYASNTVKNRGNSPVIFDSTFWFRSLVAHIKTSFPK